MPINYYITIIIKLYILKKNREREIIFCWTYYLLGLICLTYNCMDIRQQWVFFFFKEEPTMSFEPLAS